MTTPRIWTINPDTFKSIFELSRSSIHQFYQAKAGYADYGNKHEVELHTELALRQLGANKLPQDLFLALYNKYMPKQRGHVSPDLLQTQTLVDGLVNSPAFNSAKAQTQGDKALSMMLALDMTMNFVKELDRELKDAGQNAAKEEQAQQEQKEEESQQDGAGDGQGEGQDDSQQDGAGDGQGEGQDDSQQEQGEAAQAYQDLAQASKARIQKALNSSIESTVEKSEQKIAFAKAFSKAAGNDGKIDSSIIKEAMKAFADLKDLEGFEELADILGWSNRFLTGLKRKADKPQFKPSKMAGMELNPNTIDQRELQALNGVLGPMEKLMAVERLANDSLMHRSTEGEENEDKKGGVVLMGDESTSMGGREIITLKALTWALVSKMREDDRDFTSVQFAGEDDYTVWTAPKGNEQDLEGLTNIMSRSHSGGTEPYSPMLDIFERIETGMIDKSDIVIITDGLFDEPLPEFLQKVQQIKEEFGVKIFTINVWGENTEAQKFSDLCLSVDDLYLNRAELAEAFSQLF